MALYIFLICILVVNLFLCFFILYRISKLKDYSFEFYKDLFEELREIQHRYATDIQVENVGEKILKEIEKLEPKTQRDSEDKWKNFEKAFRRQKEKDNG